MGFFSGLNDEKYDRQYTDRQLTAADLATTSSRRPRG